MSLFLYTDQKRSEFQVSNVKYPTCSNKTICMIVVFKHNMGNKSSILAKPISDFTKYLTRIYNLRKLF
ncbi:hypothetical protein DEAC_c31950 [Desulfosporosinus acididurans]|uniref:Uncharacterized protein n=1 Tax=Desulfosporosinus acididurans TaxID=476652 RepID=A0A0J1FND9_9FIRM|nr:hypothetical protein DEAC_c31950 [Desulfosporosinus acididurans]